MQSDKEKKLKALLELTNEGLTRKEFLDSFKKVINQVLKIETQVIAKINTAIDDMKSDANTLNKATQSDITTLINKVDKYTSEAKNEQTSNLNAINEVVKKLKKSQDENLKFIANKVSKLKSGIDGKDADEEKIIKEILNKIEIPESPQNIGIEDVGNLRDELEELRKIKSKGGGGGVSALGVAQAAKWIVRTEKPIGDIDGANTEFTVSKPRIYAVLSMSLNGEFIAQLPNYTINGNKITFTEAIPSAYLNKDWEIVYI